MPLDNNLLLAFCSIKIDIPPEEQQKRYDEHYLSFRQIKNVLPSTFDMIICDNTIGSVNDLEDPRLREIFMKEEHFLLSENLGSTNKGIGELDMLCSIVEDTDIEDYDSVSYLTARRIITCPYVFERVENMEKDALISNPPIIDIITGKQHETNHLVYNDMFFSMKPSTMRQYSEYTKSRLQSLAQQSIASERNLYQFINENRVDFEWMNSLGFIRFDRELGTIQHT